MDKEIMKIPSIEEIIVAVDDSEKLYEESVIRAACTCFRYGTNEDKEKCALGVCEVLKEGYKCPRLSSTI